MIPNTDAGSDALARFRYQATVALPYCESSSLLKNDIEALVTAFLEDVTHKTNTGVAIPAAKEPRSGVRLVGGHRLVGRKRGRSSLPELHVPADRRGRSLTGACARRDGESGLCYRTASSG